MAPGDIAQMESYIDFMREHIRKCRKNHKKLSYSKMKFWAGGLYDWIVQTERLEKGLGPMVCGIDDVSARQKGKEKMSTDEIRKLWDDFSEVPVNNEDNIEKDFMDFPAGTDRFEVLSWFDRMCPNGMMKDLLKIG